MTFDATELVRIVPLWGSFIVLAGILVRQLVPWRQLTLNSEQQIRKEMQERIDGLKKEHQECIEKLTRLHEELHGQRRQNIQEQISLINAIISSVDAPQLKTMLRTLESVQAAIQRREG